MISVLDQLVEEYGKRSVFPDAKSVMKGIMQDIILCGLSRAGFFKKAALCGSVAMRFHSCYASFGEDLEFALTDPNSDLDLAEYIPYLKRELGSYGLKAVFEKQNKENLMVEVQGDEFIKIRLKVGHEPEAFASFEYRYRLLPASFDFRLYDMPSLFTVNLCTLLGKDSEKGIDGTKLNDYLCFTADKTPVDLKNLKNLLVNADAMDSSASFTLETLKNMLKERFRAIDYESAKQDILPFISRPDSLQVWSPEFFCSITDQFLKAR